MFEKPEIITIKKRKRIEGKMVTEDKKVMNNNVMCLVGNGFDMGALKWLYERDDNMAKLGPITNGNTSYPHFFEYLTHDRRDNDLKKNLIYREMKKARKEYDKSVRKKEKYEKELEKLKKSTKKNEDTIKNKETKISEIERKIKEKSNWSDFELIVDKMIFENDIQMREYPHGGKAGYCKKIEDDLVKLQRKFSSFLNELLPAEKIVGFDVLVSKGQYAYGSLMLFLQDLQYEEELPSGHWSEFKKKGHTYFAEWTGNDHTLNFLFVDFNYTMLLDDYINLDREQFEPKKYMVSENNFVFRQNSNPMDNNEYIALSGPNYGFDYPLSVKINTRVVHPHGIQDAPRSILFGTEKESQNRSSEQFTSDERWRFVKSLWAQDSEKYQKDIDNTQLFIIYGMSISKVDGWWMTRVYRRLAYYYGFKEKGKRMKGPEDYYKIPELIIYNHYSDGRSAKEVFDAFLGSCIYLRSGEKSEEIINFVKSRTHIIIFGDKNRKNVFLGFMKEDPDENKKMVEDRKIFKTFDN